MFSRFLVVFEGPGGFKQLRDTCRMNFHHYSYLYVFMVPSYEEKTERGIFSSGYGMFLYCSDRFVTSLSGKEMIFSRMSILIFRPWVKDSDILDLKNGFYVKCPA